VVSITLPDGQLRRYFLDTGAVEVNVAPSDAQFVTKQPDRLAKYFHGGGATDFRGVGLRDCSLRLGGIAFEHFDAVTIPYPKALLDETLQPVQGGLSYLLFYDVLLTIDYGRHELIIERGELPPPNGSDILPLKIGPDFNIEMPVTLEGHPYWVLLDTGNVARNDCVSIGAKQLPGVKWVRPPTPTTVSVMGGSVQSHFGLVAGDLQIGRYSMELGIESGTRAGEERRIARAE
jgi:hypothetical protein